MRTMLVVLVASLSMGPARGATRPLLVDATTASGVAFVHHAARSERWLLPETMGSGVALIDLDGDADLDLLLLDMGAPPGSPVTLAAKTTLWRNVSRPGALRFEPLPAPDLAGIAAMGACTGDVDGDGDADVYVTGLPKGRLFLSDSGRLERSSTDPGDADVGWGTSCVLFDRDRDGDLDLFVAHYVAWSAATDPPCGGERKGFRSYCPPDRYPPEQDRLFDGDGKGRFVDVTAAAGLQGERGKGLGVVAADLDGNGLADLYVANDQTASRLWLNEAGRFRDVGVASGTAYSEDGRAQAGMGVDAADVDGRAGLDLVKTNLDLDTNNLYVALGSRAGAPRYVDAITSTGLAQPSFMMLGFGALLDDFDADGDVDLFIANGHILPNVAALRPDQTHAMRSQLFLASPAKDAARPPSFREAREAWRPASEESGVGRGLACGDLDGDGDLDIVETRNDGPVRILRNDADPRRWLGLVLKATRSAPGAPASSVRVYGVVRSALRRTGGSYLSASDPRVLVALSATSPATATATITWTSGLVETFGPLETCRYVTVVEGQGAAAR